MNTETLTIQQLLQKGTTILETQEIFNPQLDAQLLLGYVLNVDKVYIYTHREEVIGKELVDKYFSLINKRSEGYPLQYILGKQEFMGLDFKVGEGVLVPRPDTEILVEWVIETANSREFNNNEYIKILDIGTGSGAIALSLAHYIKKAKVYTVDISDAALKIARENTQALKLEDRVNLLKGNLFDPIKYISSEDQDKFDIIVSNPPYIPSEEIDKLQTEVSTYEPRLALDGGIDGLDFYRRIISQSPNFLKDGGLLFFEIGYNQGEDLRKLLLEQKVFYDITIRKDLAGHDRVVMARRESNR